MGIIKPLTLSLAIASGSLTIARDAVFITSGVTLEPGSALWAWLRVCFVISSGIVWVQQHKRIKSLESRLAPRLKIENLQWRDWPIARHGFTGREYYFDVRNLSQIESLEGVRVDLVTMQPDPIGFLGTTPLHIKHESYGVREFSINPGSVKQIDLITGPVNDPKSQQAMTVAHTVQTEQFPIPFGRYRLTVRVSAKNAPPEIAIFEAMIDNNGEIICVVL